MSQFDYFLNNMGKAWEAIADGWQQIIERAPHALTQFRSTEGDTPMDQFRATRWAFLPSEVTEYPEVVVVKLEIPGMTPAGLDLHVEDDVLVVSGTKEDQAPPDTPGNAYVREIAYGAFQRRIPLPCAVDEHATKAQYRHGVLNVTLPKITRRGSQRIHVTPT